MVNDKYGLFKSFDENMKLRNEEVAAFADKCRRSIDYAKNKNSKKIQMIAVIVVITVICSIPLYCALRKPTEYWGAQFLAEKEEYVEAAEKYYALGDYKDSSNKLEEVMLKAVDKAEVGDIVPFGVRESHQDEDFEEGQKNVLEWIVIDNKNGEKLLFSKEVLYDVRYLIDEENELRKNLASKVDSWFTDAEKSRLVEKQITTKQYYCRASNVWDVGFNLELYEKSKLNKTYSSKQKLFLLSVDEFNSLVKQNEEWACASNTSIDGWTTRTRVLVEDKDDHDDYYSFFVRVDDDGEIKEDSLDSYLTSYTYVRPAMWVKAE